MNNTDFTALVLLAFKKEALKKIVFSRPKGTEVKKVSGRLCAHRGRRILALEYSLSGNTVSQRNISEAELEFEISALISKYAQTNLITSLGDAEFKLNKSGSAVALGADKLLRKLTDTARAFESALEELDKRKNYILSGSEDFLIRLGISDKSGRVHDKKQGKFRQINRFLEHISDLYLQLPSDGEINIYDLCSGKSYLSFAVYYYLTAIKKREVKLLGIDLKRDVIDWCDSLARELGFDGMRFIADDIKNTPDGITPDLVISLHACDVATDIVLNTAIRLGAKIILSTPCCHRYLNDKISASSLSFITDYPQLRNKLCEAATDAIRIARLRAFGYDACALELTDPENTPKNTLIRALKDSSLGEDELSRRRGEYDGILTFLMGEEAENYLKGF